MWVFENDGYELWKQDVPHGRDEGKEDEETYIEHEEYNRYDLEPISIVRQLVKGDGQDASAHGNNEPSARYQLALHEGIRS